MRFSRRDLFVLGFSLGNPVRAIAQPVRRVGIVLSARSDEEDSRFNISNFEKTIRALGWHPGKDLQIIVRWTSGSRERAQTFVTELTDSQVDVLVANSTGIAQAVQRTSRTVPVVFFGVSDPVAQGIVTGLNRPGGMMTGFASYEFSIGAKWLGLLQQVNAGLNRVAMVGNASSSPQVQYFATSVSAAAGTKVEFKLFDIANRIDIEAACTWASGAGSGGLIMANDQFIKANLRSEAAEIPVRSKVPAVYAQKEFVSAGGLMSYGLSESLERGIAVYVDKILRGVPPRELPVQQPNRYELAINLAAATNLGWSIPTDMLLSANDLI